MNHIKAATVFTLVCSRCFPGLNLENLSSDRLEELRREIIGTHRLSAEWNISVDQVVSKRIHAILDFDPLCTLFAITIDFRPNNGSFITY